eukprot:scaffold25149_cov122-Cylindrotheca_fusiformis.AAC.2
MMVSGLLLSFQNIRYSDATSALSKWSYENAATNDEPTLLKLLSSDYGNKKDAPTLLQLQYDGRLPNLEELVEYNLTCPPGLAPIKNVHYPAFMTHPEGWKIPKIIHITSRHRCATNAVIENVKKWYFRNYSVYFHDDRALQKLFTHPVTRSRFPSLRDALKCATNGATKSDLWRYLVLYMYGGVYTDIDNSPTGFNGETIKPSDDSFFVIEQLGIMSQYFLASSIGHPLMAQMLETGIERLKQINNVMVNNPAQNTGPGACKVGFIEFMAAVGVQTTGYIDAGVYVGEENRSVTVVGAKNDSQQYVSRVGLKGSDKREYYKALGISHFSDRKSFPPKGQISCLEHLQRTNGTDKVAKYHFVAELGEYVESNDTVRGKYNLIVASFTLILVNPLDVETRHQVKNNTSKYGIENASVVWTSCRAQVDRKRLQFRIKRSLSDLGGASESVENKSYANARQMSNPTRNRCRVSKAWTISHFGLDEYYVDDCRVYCTFNNMFSLRKMAGIIGLRCFTQERQHQSLTAAEVIEMWVGWNKI